MSTVSVFKTAPPWAPGASLPLAEVAKGTKAGSLNAEQLAAVEVLEGRHVINSGAGTGKSSVLVARMALIQQAFPGSRILMISFTKKAAQELRNRIGNAPNVTVSTLHSLSYHILRSAGVNYSVITNEATQEAVIAKLIGKKNTTVEDVRRSLHQIEVDDAATKTVREKYLEYLRKQKQMTFDTMQIFALRVLQDNPSLLRQWQERFDFYEIDEGQDIETVQERIIELLSQRTESLTIVGDKRQSVYGFRGAKNCMDKFAENATQYDLSINYRSNRAILGLANQIMAKDKPLLAADASSPNYPKYLMAADGRDEAKAVADEIVALHKKGSAYRDMAVLFRSCAASSYLVQELLQRKIPALSKGAVSLTYTRPPYCGIVRLFRFMLAPDDRERFKAILPILYLRKGMLQEIVSIAGKNGCSLMDAAQELSLPFFHLEYLSEMADALKVAREMTPSQAALHLLKHGYGKYVGPEMEEAVKGMADELKDYPSITAYLNFLDDLQEQAEEMRRLTATSNDYLQLLTIHASKGKEWDTVFLIGAQDGCLPSNHEGTDLEEERRLLYVAVTRAKQHLYISWPRLSDNHTEPNEVSRFLREIF